MRIAAGLAALIVTAAATAADATDWRPLPWHLIDHTYRIPPAARFHSLNMDVELTGTPATGDFLYVAPLWGEIGGNGFYFGLQTDIWDGHCPCYRGKGAIFSRWGRASLADARPAAAGWSEALDAAHSAENAYAGVRLPYGWRGGAYHFHLAAQDTADGGCWVDLTITEDASGRTDDVGSLHFPRCGPVMPSPVSFVEVYGRNAPAPPRIPTLTVRFHGPVVNGQPIVSAGSWYIPTGVPPVARPELEDDGMSVSFPGRM